MIRRLRRGSKRAATRDGYNDVNDQGSYQDDIFIDAAYKQLNSHSPDPVSPSRSSSYPQKNKIKQSFDSPDDVSKGFTSLTYESSLTGGSNTSKSRNGDNSVSFSTIWEREENDVEPHAVNANSTPMRIAEARRSALNIARHDRTSNKMHINSRRNSESKQRSTVLVSNSDMRNTKYNAAQISSSRRDSSPYFDNDHQKAQSQQWKTSNSVASSAQTPKLNNESRHMISRLLKTHQSGPGRSNDKNNYATSLDLSKRELAPTVSVKRNHQASSRKPPGERPDPTSKSSVVANRLDRAPDPPAEVWERPIPVKHVASNYTKHTASSSKFWDEVEKFPAVKGDRELQQFFRQNLVRVKKEAVILDTPRKTSGIQVLETNQRNDARQDDTDNFSNAFSLNLAMDKQGHFDDSDISALEMFDSATVYHQNALAMESGDKNYWKLKYDRLKQETRAAMKEEKIVEEPVEDEGEEVGQQEEPRPKTKLKQKSKPKSKPKPMTTGDNEINRLFSGLTVDLDDGDASPFCRNELKQTMNVLMQKVNEIENSGKLQLDRRIEDNACAEMAEQVIFPVNAPESEQKRSLADDLTAGASSHLLESEPTKAQRFTPICTISETEIISVNDEQKDVEKPLSSDDDQLVATRANIITPEKQDNNPTKRHTQAETKYEFAHPMICLGSLQAEATSSTRVKKSLLRCSDSLMSRFLSNSNQLANPYGVDPQNIIRLCQNPQMARKSISQTIVHYGKKVMKKREVISELNHNILRFGGRHPLVGESHLKVGIVHMFDGHYADSVLHLEEAIKIKTYLEPEHQDIPSIIMFIALDQLALERFDDCMASLLAVRRLCEDAIGKTHPEIGSILNNIACLHYELGNSIQAEKLFQEALDLQRESFTTDPTFLNSVSTLLSNIAFLHAKNGMFSKALIELEGALQIQQEILCDEGSESEAILENIAHIMAIQKMQHGSGNMEEITNQYMTMLKRH